MRSCRCESSSSVLQGSANVCSHIVYGRKPFGPTFLVENVDAEEDAIAAGVYP